MHETNMQTPLHRCTGYVGFATRAQMIRYLEDAYWRKRAGIPIERSVFLAKDHAKWLEGVSSDRADLVSIISHHEILSLLETDDAQYAAAGFSPKGCMNSASFTEELAGYLLAQYPDRFTIFEYAIANILELNKTGSVIHANGVEVRSQKTVLCTNGFEQITILNRGGSDIDVNFHQQVHGTVGYMQAYLDPIDRAPTAISYFSNDAKVSEQGDIYYYLTRRPHEKEKHIRHNIVCIGGPEERLPERATYNKNAPFPDKIKKEIGAFIEQTYEHTLATPTEPAYTWHGLMGYTANGIRLIGPEPCNPHLLYNLGCNGIGILPSIYGGKRIAQFLSGKKVKPSIFDPKDYRCAVDIKKTAP
jgi:glycine/D-amino acid oxidase-like deaminating enzyme